MVKFGFKTFVKATNPIPHPKREFDKTRDFKKDMPDLCVYLTKNGKIAKRTREHPSGIIFWEYGLHGNIGKAKVWVHRVKRWKFIPVEDIHFKEAE